jgi:hypothetical protein
MKRSRLQKTISYILQSPMKTYRRLPGGLVLSYTPPDQNEKAGFGRMVCSRENNVPSQDEVEIVARDLKEALLSLQRPYEQFTKSPVQQEGAWCFVVLEWRDGHQEPLFGGDDE